MTRAGITKGRAGPYSMGTETQASTSAHSNVGTTVEEQFRKHWVASLIEVFILTPVQCICSSPPPPTAKPKVPNPSCRAGHSPMAA